MAHNTVLKISEKSLPRQELLEHLKQFRIFSQLPENVLKQLVPLYQAVHYSDGQEILKEEQPNTTIYFLLKGMVKVFSKGALILTLSRKGDPFGEMSVITGKPCSASVVAEGDVDLLYLNGQELTYSQNTAMDIRETLHRVFSIILSDKLVLTTQKARQFEATNQELLQTHTKLKFRIALEKLLAKISSKFVNAASDKVENEIRNALSDIGAFLEIDRCYLVLFSQKPDQNNSIYEWYDLGLSSRRDWLFRFTEKLSDWLKKNLQNCQGIYIPHIELDVSPNSLPEENSTSIDYQNLASSFLR